MPEPTDVVIAGTKTFALALFAPVTERAGSRPRIAPEPSVALTLCAQSSGVLVVEYEPRWLPALTQLRQERPSLRVVAALARGQESAALSLGPLAVDAVPWDGQLLSVMPAIERAIDGSRAAATATQRHTQGGAAPLPGSAALSQSAPTLSRSAPSLAQSSPSLSSSSPTLSRSAPSLSQSSPAIPSGPPKVSVSVAAPTAPLDLFTDLGATAATPSPASLAAVGTLPVPRTAAAIWPATGPSAAEAELALRARLAGKEETSSLRSVIDQVVAGLSTLERDLFTGGGAPFDAELIRHAAVLRLRAAAALATRPPPRTPVDSVAVAELLSEIDGVLHKVKALVDVATPEQKPQLEAIRNALVREAVDFSEACHEIGTAELPLPGAPATARSPGRAAAARVLSSHVGLDEEDRPEEVRRRTAPLIGLLVVLLLGGAYHAWRLYSAPPRLPPATYEGAPAGTMAFQNGKASFLKLLPGQVVNAAELESFKQREAKRGNTLRELGDGLWIIEPATAETGAKP